MQKLKPILGGSCDSKAHGGLLAMGKLAVCFLAVSAAQGVGLRLPNQDPEGIARGNAFVATADNPSAIYYNPAGITQLEGQQVRAGIYAISTDVEFTSPTGVKAKTDTSIQPVPQLYYVNSFKELPLTLGLGVYAPYGLAIDWGNNTPFRSAVEKGTLEYITFNPVIAWKILPSLSIAAGPMISYSEAELEQGVALPGDKIRFRGDDVGTSFNAGIRWQPLEQLAFGVNYRYLTTMNYDGTIKITPSGLPYSLASTPTTATIRFPQSVAMGVSYRPTPNWNLEFNADWTDWDNLNQIGFQGLPFPPVNLNYKSSWMYEAGVTRKLCENYFLSVGYIYSENSSPDPGFDPLVPDSQLHLGSIGFSRRGKTWDWAVAYHFGYNASRTVSGSQVFGGVGNGTYETFNNAVNVAATFKF